MEMTCPKCMGSMRQFERSGVVVDQCTECRGIYLDRGELEKLVDAENAWHGGASPAGPPPAGAEGPAAAPAAAGHAGPGGKPERGQGRWEYDSDEYPMYGKGGKKKKRRGFLEELFD